MVRFPLTPAEIARGQRLGAVLRRARAERSMLQTALDARISPETLRKIETGRVATPAFPTVAAIAEVLGLSLDAVWAHINEPEHKDEPANLADFVHERSPTQPHAHSYAIYLQGVGTVPTTRTVDTRRP